MCLTVRSRQRPIGRRPTDLRLGAGVLASTVTIGMLVRRLATERGTPITFIVVATLFLGLFLLGWRLLVNRFLPGDAE